ncbi:MAG: peptidase dimerization domain-containing protein [Desulfobacterales bacterium]
MSIPTTSGPLIRQEAAKSLFAFVLECGGLEGEVVTGRKGSMSLELETYGKAGHAAFAGKDKASAILEMAHKIISIEALNDPLRKITANAGKVSGGVGPNTVPDYAVLKIDVRYENPQDRKVLEEKIEKTARTSFIPGVSSSMQIVGGRPPMPQSIQNQQLFDLVKKVAEELNMDIKEEFRAGVSDANLIADENTAVLDGLGPIGAEDHSENEYMIKKSLFDRTVLVACSILKCWDKAKYSRGILVNDGR